MEELIKVENGTALLNVGAERVIIEFEEEIKRVREAEAKIKAQILKEMEEKKILKIDTPAITISYIAPTDREQFDSKKFKKEYPRIYDEYVKMTPVKSSIRMKIK